MTGRKQKGFTLVEMSVVLIVIGLVILIVFPAMKSIREGTQRTETVQNLATLTRAAAAFAQAKGCLPCPTPAGTSGAGFGHVRGDGQLNAPLCGLCAKPEGIPPFADLGLPAAAAKDGWGRWITMRIDPYLATNFGIVPPTAPCTETNANCLQGMSQQGLCQKNISLLGTPISVRLKDGGTQRAAILLLSHGPDGFGAYRASPVEGLSDGDDHLYNGPAPSCTASAGYERCNADGDASFVDAPATNKKTDPFDDMLFYMDRNVLIGFLGQQACQTTW